METLNMLRDALRRSRNSNYDDECWRSNGFERLYRQGEEAPADYYANGRNDQMKIKISMKNPICKATSMIA
ncbi:hypothetical protein F2Q69_00030686 [Brassica cretica]|uniref:Uncharacterized protein n=1 Tax=Brassica cretica TaxID=69181 RepID=A0A8S9S138_BRACR|nr:hypothetical protein F2Q69_00030686 [Brassica cretica]